MIEKEEDNDINDVFDDILLSEEKAIEKSYTEGFKIGSAQGNPEAYHLGYHRGAELGSEIGYYAGITESYLKYTNLSEKIVKSLENLKGLLDNFPHHNSEHVDLMEQISIVRAKFKKISAQLKVDIAYRENSNLSF